MRHSDIALTMNTYTDEKLLVGFDVALEAEIGQPGIGVGVFNLVGIRAVSARLASEPRLASGLHAGPDETFPRLELNGNFAVAQLPFLLPKVSPRVSPKVSPVNWSKRYHRHVTVSPCEIRT